MWKFHRRLSIQRLISSRIHSRNVMRLDFGGLVLMVPPDNPVRCYAYSGVFSANVGALIQTLKPLTFLDGGAFLGQHSQQAIIASSGQALVYAYEPDPRARALLELSLAASGFAQSVKIRDDALSGEPGQLFLNFGRTLSESSVEGIDKKSRAPGCLVPAVSLRREVERCNPDFIKLDLEGHEPTALLSLSESSIRPVMMVEASAATHEMAKRLGYAVWSTEDLYGPLSRFTNSSEDFLLAAPSFVTPALKKQLQSSWRAIMKIPSVTWL